MKFNEIVDYKYLLFYKPDGVICQFSEHEKHPSLSGFIPVKDVYPAGRLDTDSEGLLLLTSDGLLSHWLTDPKRHCPKIYYAQVEGEITVDAIKSIRNGVVVKGYHTLPCQVEKIETPEIPPAKYQLLRMRPLPGSGLPCMKGKNAKSGI